MTVWPALVYLALSVLGLGFAIAKHGQPRDPYSMWAQMFAMAISWPLLWWGGFFDAILARM